MAIATNRKSRLTAIITPKTKAMRTKTATEQCITTMMKNMVNPAHITFMTKLLTFITIRDCSIRIRMSAFTSVLTIRSGAIIRDTPTIRATIVTPHIMAGTRSGMIRGIGDTLSGLAHRTIIIRVGHGIIRCIGIRGGMVIMDIAEPITTQFPIANVIGTPVVRAQPAPEMMATLQELIAMVNTVAALSATAVPSNVRRWFTTPIAAAGKIAQPAAKSTAKIRAKA